MEEAWNISSQKKKVRTTTEAKPFLIPRPAKRKPSNQANKQESSTPPKPEGQENEVI